MTSFDEQLRELIPRLRRFALSLTRHASNADDLVQTCLERALGSVAEKRPEGDLRAWLFTPVPPVCRPAPPFPALCAHAGVFYRPR